LSSPGLADALVALNGGSSYFETDAAIIELRRLSSSDAAEGFRSITALLGVSAPVCLAAASIINLASFAGPGDPFTNKPA
jgi:hypothetical protein